MAEPPRQRKRTSLPGSAGCLAANASNCWRTLRQNSVSFQSAGGMVTATIGSGATISANAGRSATPSMVDWKTLASSRPVSRTADVCSL